MPVTLPECADFDAQHCFIFMIMILTHIKKEWGTANPYGELGMPTSG